MHAASRAALAATVTALEQRIAGREDALAALARIGTSLFDIVDVLDHDRGLRVALAEASTDPAHRERLARDLLGSKIDADALEIVCAAVRSEWSSPREMREGLVAVARRSLLLAAQKEGLLPHVEEQLFSLAQLLGREPRLTQLLTDKTASPEARRSLLAQVVYGKMQPVAETLALQAIGRQVKGPIADLNQLACDAAALEGREVAHITAATELRDDQRRLLSQKLEAMYGVPMILHIEVDESILGGLIIRVGDEVIDGSTSGKIEQLKAHVG